VLFDRCNKCLKAAWKLSAKARRLQVLHRRRSVFDKGGGYDYDSTAIQPRYNRSTTIVTTGLLHCSLNK